MFTLSKVHFNQIVSIGTTTLLLIVQIKNVPFRQTALYFEMSNHSLSRFLTVF